MTLVLDYTSLLAFPFIDKIYAIFLKNMPLHLAMSSPFRTFADEHRLGFSGGGGATFVGE